MAAPMKLQVQFRVPGIRKWKRNVAKALPEQSVPNGKIQSAMKLLDTLP
jgi:hypothetical protein